MRKHNLFFEGFKAMLPVTTGVIPFGAVMGTVCSEAHLSFLKTIAMNVLVFAGASQLAAVDLMNKQAAIVVVVATGLIINLRFLLYSAALSPVVHLSGFWVRFFSAYLITDQNYAVMSANEKKLHSHHDSIVFYFGASVCMLLAWHLSVVAGYVFGNFAPPSWNLDFAVPLSFVALMIPTLKNSKYVLVALFSSVVSVLLYPLPYKVSLILTAILGIALAMLLTRKKKTHDSK